MNDVSRSYDVTVTITKNGCQLPGPEKFGLAAELAASNTAASGVLFAHTADKIITVVTVETSDPPLALATALDVVSKALIGCGGFVRLGPSTAVEIAKTLDKGIPM